MNKSKLFILTLFGLMLKFSGLFAQDPSWSLDVIGGSPYILSNVKTPQQSPFGGIGLRYSITQVLSAQFLINGGVLAGNNEVSGTYFSDNFIQYSFRGILNVSGLINKPKLLSRLNAYLYLGAGHIKCYKGQQINSGNTDNLVGSNVNSLFYVSNFGINLRYYLNENIDFIAGSEINFTQTRWISNNPNGNEYDKYLMNYIGISFKILQSTHKKQNPDWLGIKLPYDNYDEQLKIAQSKVTEAEIKSDLAVKEAKTSIADANAKLAKAEEFSLNVTGKINSLKVELDTMKEIITIISNKVTNNTISVSQSNNQNPNNNILRVIPSNNVAENTMPSQYFVENKNNPQSLKIQKKENSTNIAYVEKEIVKPIDITKKFAVVLGSYIKHENALNAKKQLSDKGYQIDMVHFDDPNVNRLVIYFDSKEDAQNRLSEIREKENAEAWLLTINQLTLSSK